MSTHFARLNIQFTNMPNIEQHLIAWDELLCDFAAEGYADEFEFFYINASNTIGISVSFEQNDAQEMLEAGAVLGYVQRCYEQSDMPTGTTWISIHDAKDNTISTVHPFN